MISDKTSLVLGRGELFFNPFEEYDVPFGVGEVYIGNTPEFSTSREITTLSRYDSYDGQRIAIPGPVIRESHTARFTTDHIDIQNLAYWYGRRTPIVTGQGRASDIQETFPVYRNRFYQLGVTSGSPVGAREIAFVNVKMNGVSLDMGVHYDLDESNARLHILPNAPGVLPASILTVTYERRDADRVIITSARRELFGSLRFVSRNPVGPAKNYFYPKVKLTPTGDIDQKSSDWQRMSFEVEAQRRSPAFEYVYIDELINRGSSILEDAIIVSGGITIAAFPFWESELNTIVNVTIPSHNLR